MGFESVAVPSACVLYLVNRSVGKRNRRRRERTGSHSFLGRRDRYGGSLREMRGLLTSVPDSMFLFKLARAQGV